MKKGLATLILLTLTCLNTSHARQIVDNTNKFYINLPDRYLLEEKTTTDNKYVVMEAFDPTDDSTFTVKISPSDKKEVRGIYLDDERTKFRTNLEEMGLEPYVEGIIHIAPSHESIYTFSKVNDQGEVLNYLIAKFWAHNKEYAFYCIQPTKTLRTQEFIDSIDSFRCLQHTGVSIPYPEKKERPKYDEAKRQYDNLVKKTNLEAEKLKFEGKDKEAKELLEKLPKFEEKPVEYIPKVEINSGKPLPLDITDKTAHDMLYSEEPEKVLKNAKAKAKADKVSEPKYTEKIKEEQPVIENNKKVLPPKNSDENKEQIITVPKISKPLPQTVKDDNTLIDIVPKDTIKPPTIINDKKKTDTQPRQKITIIKDGKAVDSYIPQTEKVTSSNSLTEKERKKIDKLNKEKIKIQKKLDEIRRKELERQRKEIEKELKSRKK